MLRMTIGFLIKLSSNIVVYFWIASYLAITQMVLSGLVNYAPTVLILFG
jgi:hypothetical protein